MRAVKDLQPISRAGIVRANGRSSGILLLDMAIALAILLLLFAVIWPTLGRGTTRFRQSALALEIANVLRADRTSASLTGTPASTHIDLDRRTITGTQGRPVKIPDDVALEVTTGSACVAAARHFVIVFAADGTSCGGLILLTRGPLTYVVRFNWLSGMIDVYRTSKA
jgi:general secretion pathway protein H